MQITPCDFSLEEYQALVKIWNITHPMYPSTVEEIKKDDETRAEKIKFKRYMMYLDDEPIGFGVFLNTYGTYHPQKFMITPVIVPEHHAKGYGKALYDFLIKELEPFKPIELFSWSREDWPRKIRFLEDRGFTEALRSFESRLEVNAFDPEPYAALEAKLKNEGIEIKTATALREDADFHQKVYDLHTTLDLDVPTVGEVTKPDFDDFARYHWLDDTYIPETYIIATDGERYIGMSEHFKNEAVEGRLRVGLTGVVREYRRKGIALAMKVKAVRAAKAFGANELSTWNATHNTGMLAINEALGFQKQPATIDYVMKL